LTKIHVAFVDNYPAGRPLDWKKMHSLVRENKIAELENWKAHLAKTDENKENLFHSAAYGGNEETWTYLFDNGLKDIDQENTWNTFPIQIACVKNNSAALKFLLDKKANIDVKVKLGDYPDRGSLTTGSLTVRDPPTLTHAHNT